MRSRRSLLSLPSSTEFISQALAFVTAINGITTEFISQALASSSDPSMAFIMVLVGTLASMHALTLASIAFIVLIVSANVSVHGVGPACRDNHR